MDFLLDFMPQWSPNGPPMVPQWSPKLPHRLPKVFQMSPKAAPKVHQTVSDVPKTCPIGPAKGIVCHLRCPKESHMSPKVPYSLPKCLRCYQRSPKCSIGPHEYGLISYWQASNVRMYDLVSDQAKRPAKRVSERCL